MLSAFGKLLPSRWRSLAFGAGTAAGSFGQLFYAPLTVSLIDAIGWQQTLGIFGVVMLIVLGAVIAGLLEELNIHLVPVLLGSGGVRLLDGVDPTEVELTGVVESPYVTHLRYRPRVLV